MLSYLGLGFFRIRIFYDKGVLGLVCFKVRVFEDKSI